MEFKQLKTKSFWERPEGATGLVFLLAMIAGGGYLLYSYMDTLIELLKIHCIYRGC